MGLWGKRCRVCGAVKYGNAIRPDGLGPRWICNDCRSRLAVAETIEKAKQPRQPSTLDRLIWKNGKRPTR